MEKIISFIKHHTLLVLIGITFVVYIPSFFGGFLWDDEDFVFANKHVADFNVEKFFTDSATAGRGKKSNYYRPLQLTTYAFEHAIFGFNPFIFHLSNILWHIAAGVMVYLVMRSIRISWAFSLGATLIFLLHPIQTEAVSYVSGRSDMMFMFFLLLSFLCNQKRETRFVLASTFFFICALLSKESGLLAFAIFPTLSLIQYGFSPQLIHALKRYMPHMLIAIVYLLLRFTVLEFTTSYETWGDTPYSTSVTVRLATFLRNYFFYWQVLLFPFNLHMERDESTVKIVTSLISHWTVWFVATQALFIGLLWWLYKKNQQYGILAIGGYIGMHGIMGFYSGVILLNGIFYEHYLYSALPFFAIFIGGFIFAARPSIRHIALVVVGLWLLGFGVVFNIHRQLEWADSVKFFTQTLQYAPRSVRIINSLGISYAEKGNFDKAIEAYDKGLSINDTFPNFYQNKGMVYKLQKKYGAAETYFFRALDADPNFIFSMNELVLLAEEYVSSNKLQDAIRLYNKILPMVQDDDNARIQIKNRIYELEQRENEKAI